MPGLRIPGTLPNRPQQAAPDYSEIIQLAERRSSPHTSEAIGKWIALSKQEFGDLIGQDVQYKDPWFKPAEIAGHQLLVLGWDLS